MKLSLEVETNVIQVMTRAYELGKGKPVKRETIAKSFQHSNRDWCKPYLNLAVELEWMKRIRRGLYIVTEDGKRVIADYQEVA